MHGIHTYTEDEPIPPNQERSRAGPVSFKPAAQAAATQKEADQNEARNKKFKEDHNMNQRCKTSTEGQSRQRQKKPNCFAPTPNYYLTEHSIDDQSTRSEKSGALTENHHRFLNHSATMPNDHSDDYLKEHSIDDWGTLSESVKGLNSNRSVL